MPESNDTTKRPHAEMREFLQIHIQDVETLIMQARSAARIWTQVADRLDNLLEYQIELAKSLLFIERLDEIIDPLPIKSDGDVVRYEALQRINRIVKAARDE